MENENGNTDYPEGIDAKTRAQLKALDLRLKDVPVPLELGNAKAALVRALGYLKTQLELSNANTLVQTAQAVGADLQTLAKSSDELNEADLLAIMQKLVGVYRTAYSLHLIKQAVEAKLTPKGLTEQAWLEFLATGDRNNLPQPQKLEATEQHPLRALVSRLLPRIQLLLNPNSPTKT